MAWWTTRSRESCGRRGSTSWWAGRYLPGVRAAHHRQRLGSIDDAKEDFGVQGVYVFAANPIILFPKSGPHDVKKRLDAGPGRRGRAADQGVPSRPLGNLLFWALGLPSPRWASRRSESPTRFKKKTHASIRIRRWHSAFCGASA